MSDPYPLRLLSHGADAEVMLFIVVEVFRLERVRFESRPLFHMEAVVLDVGFHAVSSHEAVIFLRAIAGIGNQRMGRPAISFEKDRRKGIMVSVSVGLGKSAKSVMNWFSVPI